MTFVIVYRIKDGTVEKVRKTEGHLIKCLKDEKLLAATLIEVDISKLHDVMTPGKS